MTASPQRRRAFYLVAGLLLTALGILGLVREQRQGWGGFIYGTDRVIGIVEPNTAAERAGLQPGDSVISVDGTPSTDLPMQSRWANTRAGQTRRLLVRRGDSQLAVDVAYDRKGPNMIAWGALEVLTVFLWCGLWAGLAVASPAATALLRAGLAAGVAVAAVPNLGGVWNGIVSHTQTAALVLLTFFLLRFFLLFPTPKRVAGSRVVSGVMVTAWLAFVAYLVLELFTHPRFYLTTGSVAGPLMLGALALALVALIHTVVSTPRGTLWTSGVGWALLGALVGIGALLLPVVAMMLRLPLGVWGGLLVGAVPIAFALAVRQAARQAS
jgi:hypothetical protein